MELYHPILRKILSFGVDSVKLDKLPIEQKKALLKHAGTVFLHRCDYEESAKAFAAAKDTDSLNQNVRWFLEEHKPHIAALFAVHLTKNDLLEKIATECIETGHLDQAILVYQKLHDDTMVRFIYENLRQPGIMH